jgi:hypothetical protein
MLRCKHFRTDQHDHKPYTHTIDAVEINRLGAESDAHHHIADLRRLGVRNRNPPANARTPGLLPIDYRRKHLIAIAKITSSNEQVNHLLDDLLPGGANQRNLDPAGRKKIAKHYRSRTSNARIPRIYRTHSVPLAGIPSFRRPETVLSNKPGNRFTRF